MIIGDGLLDWLVSNAFKRWFYACRSRIRLMYSIYRCLNCSYSRLVYSLIVGVIAGLYWGCGGGAEAGMKCILVLRAGCMRE